MKFGETPLKGAFVVELDRMEDERGFFARSFCEKEFSAQALASRFVQCNVSFNKKAGTLRGKARLRHGLRGALLLRSLPREAEYANLVWLSQRLFRVPRPLAAVSIRRGGLPLYQALLLELLEGLLLGLRTCAWFVQFRPRPARPAAECLNVNRLEVFDVCRNGVNRVLLRPRRMQLDW